MKNFVLLLIFAMNAAQASSPNVSAHDSRIRAVDALVERLFDLTKPGRFREERLHASENTPQVKAIRVELLGILIPFREDLEAEVVGHRLSVASGKPANAQLNQIMRRIIGRFNATVEKLKEFSIVYDDDFRLGRFSMAFAILDPSFTPVQMNPFDFTNGFAYWCDSRPKAGFLAHRNRKTGEITWHHKSGARIAVTGENADGSPVIESSHDNGLTSAFDPVQNKWIRFEGAHKAPIAAVYNPHLKTIETRTAKRNEGIAGAYNPVTKTIVWDAIDRTGVALIYDPRSNKVESFVARGAGAACITRDNDGHYQVSYSLGGGYAD